MFHVVQQAIFSPLIRRDKESLMRRMQSLLLENLVLGKKSDQKKKMRIKRITSLKLTTKENKTTPFFSKPGRVYKKMK